MSDTVQLDYDSRDAILGKPVTVYLGSDQKQLPVLSMGDADRWLAYVQPVNRAEALLHIATDDGKEEARHAFVTAMIAAVVNYCPTQISEDDIREKCSVPQLIELYQMLVDVTDPFEYSQTCSMSRVKRRLKGLPLTEEVMAHGAEVLSRRQSSQ